MDSGAELSWFPAVFLHVAGVRTADDVVFAETGDLTVLDAGPAPAAAAA